MPRGSHLKRSKLLGTCLIKDCYRPKRAKNLCSHHYSALYYANQPRDRYVRAVKSFRRIHLVREVAQITGLSLVKADHIVKIILSTIQSGLKSGEQVKIPGFGIFDTHSRSKFVWGPSPYFRPAKELRWMVRFPDYDPHSQP